MLEKVRDEKKKIKKEKNKDEMENNGPKVNPPVNQTIQTHARIMVSYGGI